MSSDPQASPRGFRWIAGVTILVLLVAGASLTAANARQGPRFISTEVNLPATVQRTGQRLLLRADQPVTPLTEQIVVTPKVPFEVRSERSEVVLRFGAVLHYSTRYEIAIPVRSDTTGATSTLRYTLRTPGAAMYVLQRAGTGVNAGPDDDVVKSTLATAERHVVHRGPRIQEFAVAEPFIAVVSQENGNGATLIVKPTDQSGPGTMISNLAVFSQLKSSGPGGLFGYLAGPLDPADQESPRLELYDRRPAT